MPARTFTLTPLFPEGMVTDVDPSLLKPTQAALIENAIWNVNGHLQKRGGLFYVTAANPLNSNTSKITSCVGYDSFAGSPGLVMGDSNGRVAYTDYSFNFVSASSAAATTTLTLKSGSPVWPILVYDDEVLVVVPTAASPLFRWAGATTAAAAGAGTVAVNTADDLIIGTGTNFLTRFPEDNQFIVITDAKGIEWYYRIAKVESDTLLRVTSKTEIGTTTGLSWAASPYGLFNISAIITEGEGRISNAGTTVTGQATSWVTPYTEVAAGDFIFQPNNEVSRWQVASVTDDNTLTTAINPGWASGKAGTITRRIFGNIACEHQNRLHFAGFSPHPNRVYLLQAGASANGAYNGIDSTVTAEHNANVAEYFDVPSPNEPGLIKALLSVREPGGLAVFRDRDFYMVYGEWPSIQVQKISSDTGCLSWRAACEIPGGVAWAGLEGVYIHRPGGGVQNIADGKIRREWTTLARLVDEYSDRLAADDVVCIAYVDDHIVVSVDYTTLPTTATTTTWAYSLRNDAWVKWTGYAPRSYSRILNPGVRGLDAYAADQNTNRFISVASAVDSNSVGSTDAVNGTFKARSGYNAFTGVVSDMFRVIDGKVTYSMVGSSSPAFVVKTGLSLDTSTTVSTQSTYGVKRFRPSSTQMGVLSTGQAFEITESTGTMTKLVIHGVEWTVRARRRRA